MDKTHTYRGHAIALNADESKDGWVGRYSVTSTDCQDTHSHGDSSAWHLRHRGDG